MKTRILIALRLAVVTIVLTGIVYPLGVTAIARLAFPGQAAGSIVYRDGAAVGSKLIAQRFASDGYFHERPSACDYDAGASAASNLGPTSAELRSLVIERVRDVRSRESLGKSAPVPADLVCASASGLDPHVSPETARLQAPRVAAARDIGVQDVLGLIDEHTERPTLGFVGAYRVNVLALNLALDQAVDGRVDPNQ